MIWIFIAVLIDFLLGDPYNFPHPVKLMGNIIMLEDKISRKIVKKESYLKVMGFLIVIVNISLGFFVPFFLLRLLKGYTYIYVIVNTYLIYTCLAAKSLSFEAVQVKKAFNKGIVEARNRLSYIVGRETKDLKKEEILRATIETVAENTSDGVIAPLFFIMIFGAPGGMCYKFVNTMDSMLGYMDKKYKDIGCFPAIVDDVFNYIPARITSILMILSSLGKFDIKRGLKIRKRDRKNHKSPNAGYPESTVAGLLGIKLGGDSFYNGLLVKKPTMGDSVEKLDLFHIDLTIKIMYRSEILFLIFYLLLLVIIKYMC
ncbi:MAG: adenosylcobinamide-phosphate synthase CbiB [Tissierella sp.]|uniref:adenosylcobinamide-phosphate synthase CbiB n=1 Tax=Tissierella sp. TaxID=41274 RepID=UPI003F9DEFE8